ncbi:hypothetical protein DM02DRAFT_668856 [Periconia macrospinosa]|uniref:Peptidase S8/S53 domain-containing protein n=1 Tax=Periconia macrospinosa TaxID=97972 RepID=A0A2V1E288_9PLEO|nr:hypothetical protein DM02DRAFT_668856 [Periconia macrospinosa]
MSDKHIDDESEQNYDSGVNEEYESSYDDDEEDYDDSAGEVFEFEEQSEYHQQLDLVDAKDKHQKIIAAAADRDLTDLETKQDFIEEFRSYFKQKSTDGFSLLHSLAREMYDKSAGKGRHDYKKYIPFLEILLDDLPDIPKERDSQDRTALHIVVEARQSEVATYLCDKLTGGDPDLLERSKKDGDTVLHLAVREHLDCIEHFVTRARSKGQKSADATLSIRGEKGNTPLHIAVEYSRCYGKQDKLVKLLLDASVRPLGEENKAKLSPFRYHGETQRTVQLHTPRMAKVRPSLASDKIGEKSRGASNMALRPRKTSPAEKESPSKSKSPASLRPRAPMKRLASDQPQQRPDPKVATAIQNMMLRHCLRTRTRDEAIKILHGPVALRQIDFDLVQTQNSSIEAEDLYKIATHLNFEPALQYVAIPRLDLLNFPEAKWKSKPFWNSKGRKDYLAIFDWLHDRGVRDIIRVIVADHEDRPHSDAAIIECLNRFGVESLDWKRFDLSSRAIVKAVPGVTRLKLYCSGNEAILSSWASKSGLVNLKQLVEVEVEMLMGLETLNSATAAIEDFKTELQRTWDSARDRELEGSKKHAGRAGKLEVKYKIPRNQPNRKNNLRGDSGRKQDLHYEQRERWMDCMKSFANIIQDFEPSSNRDLIPNVKIAIIDDGVNSTFMDLNKNIGAGQSYSIRDKEQGLWNPYYHSTNRHGTVMACLIRQMCPKAQLYVAKLDETAVQGGKVQITASSAAKAINWAREMGVNIISMSWSIDNIPNQADIRDLTQAVNDAIKAGILLFCASDDQGSSRTQDSETYPARIDPLHVFRIGAATQWSSAERTRGYILPGDKDQLISSFGEQLSGYEPRTSSALATALGSGLAALILYCAMVDGKASYGSLKTVEKMKGAFKNLCKGSDNQYPQVTEVFGGDYLPKGNMRDAEETEKETRKAIEKIVAHLLRT